LQENIVTIRDGRYVVPVKSEHKAEINGLVHDTSASGQTLFIEPLSVVEANNEIRVLKGKEQTEIERIIRELSGKCAEFADEIICGYKNIIELEICFAKSDFGAKMNAGIPEITDTPMFEFTKARHPLIDKNKVVPITLQLGQSYTAMVITGPNTGGKTVALKTAGLFVLMAQCGLMLPASYAKTGVFADVLADIGDEQSIEQSLSTFSSHMNNIIKIISSADNKTLVLLDELGGGTDPAEGAALAVSILSFLLQKKIPVIATTHYQEVKIFAVETNGVENASCEFDIETLKPTYRLTVGIPGKSNAFAIAKRLGMPEVIISEAEVLVSEENRRFERVVETLENSRRELESLKSSLAETERKSKELAEQLQKKNERAEKEHEIELNILREKTASIINETRFNAEFVLEELEQMKSEKDKQDFSERVKSSRSRLNRELDKMYDKANPVVQKKTEPYALPRTLKQYDEVILSDINKQGTLVSVPDKSGTCFVQVGLMKVKTNIANLRLQENKPAPKLNGSQINYKISSNLTRSGGMEIDIRGKNSDEAILDLDKFIDDSILSGLHLVTIIHGKGTGVLRDSVHRFLKNHGGVKSFRLGEYGEGEAGVTVANLM
jgi:DNA mismatch repair protein MutS2